MKLGRTFIALAAAVVMALTSAGGARLTDHAHPHAQTTSDRDALVALYNSTDGPNWTNNTNWLSSKPLNTWHGVTTDEGRVSGLSLSQNKLTGEIPAELGNLSNLRSLDLGGNQLTGEIPAEMGSLSSVTWLLLWGNELTGKIPAELGGLSNLENLDFGSNQLTGAIPVELGGLSNLKYLWLGRNQLIGAIPAELGSLSNLENLDLGGNQLTGAIPAELGSLSNLENLDLGGNQLTGAIPSELGNLSNLELLRLGGNQLTGCVPAGLRYVPDSDFGRLGLPFCVAGRAALVALYNATDGPNWTNNTNWLSYKPLNEWHGVTTDSGGRVTELDLADNRLTGEIPAALDSLSALESLYLSSNQLTGCVPAVLRGVPNNDFGELGLPFCVADRDVLVALYNAADGPNWKNNTNWLSYKPLNEWHGVTTDSGGRVTELDLHDNRLIGEIPPELGQLSHLRFLDFVRNRLAGMIPAELGNLSNLRELYLGGNRLTGAIPAELGNLSNLDRLFLWPNQLSGTIPAELGNLSNLRFLNLGRNRLTGAIPAELGNLSNLRYLYLGGNQLSGTIPAELGNLSTLEQLYLHENELTGAMPTELEGLSSLTNLRLWGNQWTGCLPASFRDMRRNDLEFILLPFCDAKERDALVALYNSTHGPNWTNNANWLSDKPMGQWHGVTTDARGRVTHLDLADNRLTGEIPSALGILESLQELSLSDNKLTGRIPASLGSLDSLQDLSISGNLLTGCIPGELQSVQESDLDELGLPFCGVVDCVTGGAVSNATNAGLVSDCEALLDARGTLAGSALLNWSWYTPIAQWDGVTISGTPRRVHKLYLQYKGLTGTIPPEIGGLSMLGSLDLSRNELSGEIPAEIGSLVNLRELTLRDNDLRGEIPPELGSLSKLEHLNMNDNRLYGEIPEAFANLRNLRSLSFWGNDLSGEIPSWFGRLTNLYGLSLAYNELTGTIPAEFGNLSNLTYLYLRGNQLTGEIPTELGNLTRLDWLALQNNPGLRGALPQELTKIPALRGLRFHYTGLCAPPDDSFQTWLLDVPDWEGLLCPSKSPVPTADGGGVIVRDVFGRVVNETGIVLVDWEGYIANPAMRYFIEMPAGTRFPTQAVLSSGESRMYFDRDSAIGKNGSTKVLELAHSSSDGEFLISIFPDRDTSDEKHPLTIRYKDGNGRIRSQTIDVHVIDQDLDRPLEFNIIANFSYDETGMFDNPAARKTVQQALDDWAYFFGDMGLDEVQVGEERIWMHDPGGYNSGRIITNDIAYTGFMMNVYGHPTGGKGVGGGMGDRNQTAGDVEYPLKRSGSVLLESWPSPKMRMTDWTVSIPDSDWWKSHLVGYGLNDLYSGVMHEGGHMIVYVPNHDGFAGFHEVGEVRDPAVRAYYGSYPVVDDAPHLPEAIDPASRRGAFGNGDEGEAPNGHGVRIVQKLDLLVAQATGYTLRDTSPFRELSLLDEPLADASVDIAYTHTMNAVGGIPAYYWTIESGALPDGLALDSFTGAILGTPTESGTFSFTVRLRDNTEGHPGVTRAATLNVRSQEWTCPDDAKNPGLVSDCGALLAAKDALAGSATLNWSADVPIAEWDGVTVEGTPLRVTKLDLADRWLDGSVSPRLGDLSLLKELRLGKNHLSGSIPAELGKLSALTRLDLENNDLSGPIPPSLGGMSNLSVLLLGDNNLSGAVPAALGNLSKLTYLQLRNNDLTGRIPPELGKLNQLTSLYANNNDFSGPIPAELGTLPNLKYLFLNGNDLSGPIPAELGKLSNLARLYVNHNDLSGPIPAELGRLSNLVRLYANHNQLSGTIPAELGGLENLELLYVHANNLSGSIPAELGDLSKLKRLYAYTNDLSGPIPAELGNLTGLERLHVANNNLTGGIPSRLGNLSKLTRLILSQNDLTGSIPPSLGDLSNLRVLYLRNNQLSGPIPAELGALSKLTHLYMSNNNLIGCVPAGLANAEDNDLNALGLDVCGDGDPYDNHLCPGPPGLDVCGDGSS